MHTTPLPDIVVLLAAAVAIVGFFRALKISPVLGYLVAGALIGPTGLGWIAELETTAAIAELGIVFLMFIIGLDLSWDRLKIMRKQVFGVGTAQLLLTSTAFFLIGVMLGEDPADALIISGALSISSTAVVLEVLRQRRELATQTGRLSLSILIMQDIAALPLLVLIPVLASKDGTLLAAMADAGLRAVAAFVVIAIAGRFLMRPLFRLIAKLDVHELFVATVLLVVFAIAWMTQSAGLSMALGAFLAGLFLAGTEFHQQIELDVRPFKALLMGLFFMTIGMRIDPSFIIDHAFEVVALAGGIVVVKSLVLFWVLRFFKYTKRTAGHTALLLAQGSELAFIMLGLALQLNVLEGERVQELLIVIALTMAMTPLLDTIGAELEKRWWRMRKSRPEVIAQESQDMNDHVIIAGYGRMGKLIATHLAEERISFLAVDSAPKEVSAGRKAHHPVYFGDASRPDVLNAMGVARARALVITLHEPQAADKLLIVMRQRYPDLAIVVRATDAKHVAKLEKSGATLAVPELQVSGMRMLSGLLAILGRPEEEIHRVMEHVRMAVS